MEQHKINISSFFASFAIKVDQSSVAKVNKTLDELEIRIRKLGMLNKPIKIHLSGFAVDQTKLDLTLGAALDIASERVTFEVRRFHVNQIALDSTLKQAMNRASATVSTPVGRRGATTAVAAGRASAGLSPMSLFAPALAIAAGGYGLGRLNKLNQRVVAAELQSQAVVTQAGGSVQEGTDSNNWLKAQADRVGFNYLDAVPGYNNTLAGLTHAGMTVQQGQGVFKGFSEIGRVMKLDAVHQKRLLYAVSEVADMNELQKRQLNMIGLALPGGKSLFAEAWQKQIGGNLHGQEAEDALLKAIHARQIKGNILLAAGDIASERAAPNLAKAGEASQAEQTRYQNSVTRLASVASDNGVEEGFARIFRTLTAGLNESGGLVKDLAEDFNEATKYASELLLFPQSFMRALEGKDSLVADWLGVDKTKELQEDWKNIKQIFTDISTIQFDFLPTLKSTADEIKTIFDAIAEFQKWRNGDLPTKTTEYGDIQKIKPFDGLPEYTSPAGIWDAAVNNTGVNIRKAKERGEAVYNDPNSYFYNKPELYDDVFSKESQKSQAMDMAAAQAYGVNNTNTLDITVKIDADTLASNDTAKLGTYIADAVKDHVGNMFSNVQDKFPIK